MDRFTAAVRLRAAPRIEAAPKRRPFPKSWKLDLKKPLKGQVVFIRRTNASGEVDLLFRKYLVNAKWCKGRPLVGGGVTQKRLFAHARDGRRQRVHCLWFGGGWCGRGAESNGAVPPWLWVPSQCRKSSAKSVAVVYLSAARLECDFSAIRSRSLGIVSSNCRGGRTSTLVI